MHLFGYVNVDKEKIAPCDYSMYRAVYCGVCKSCAKHLSHSARFALSYDITFLAVVLSALEDEINIVPCRCMAHPAKKHPMVIGSRAVDYAACIGAMLTYLKFDDDRRDEKKPTAYLGMLLFDGARKKAQEKYGVQYGEIMQGLQCLSELEQSGCESADKTADAFAKLLAACMTPPFVEEKNKKQLYWLGYYLGRWIYLIDAVNDLDDDIKKKSFNPYKGRFKSKAQAAQALETSLTLTLESISLAYELIEFKRNKNILDNIIYYGLPKKQETILKENQPNNTKGEKE